MSSLDCVGPFADDVATLTRAMEIIDPTFRAVSLDRAPRHRDYAAQTKRSAFGKRLLHERSL